MAPRPIPPRAILLGLALIPPNVAWIVWMERIRDTGRSTTGAMFFTAVFTLIVLVAINALARRIAPRRALRQGELLVAYSLVCLGTAMAAVDFLSPLITFVAHPFRYATADNGWERFFAFLPTWLTVRDPDALAGFYEGRSTLYTPGHLRAWLLPVACWTGFLLTLLWTLMCVDSLLRSQWVERERLSFPIVQLPIALTADDSPLWRNRLFWTGVALAGAYAFANNLAAVNPRFPTLSPNAVNLMEWLPNPPWNVMGWLGGGFIPVNVLPFAVGIGFLLPVDMLFSCWFLFWCWQLEKVAFAAMGFASERAPWPFVNEQMFGGFAAVCAFALASARPHLRQVVRRALADAPEARDPAEALSGRAALFGLLFGVAALVAFTTLAGMPVFLAVCFFALYLVVAVAVARMRSELGPPTHDLHFIGPNTVLFEVFGSANVDRASLGVFALYQWFNRAYRNHPVAHEMEAFKMAQAGGLSPRRLPVALLLAGLVGALATFWIVLDTHYRLGAAAQVRSFQAVGSGAENYAKLASWFSQPTPPDTKAMGAMGVGFTIASGLIVVRQHLPGFPLHALAFSISGGFGMLWVWSSLLVAWICKATLLRFGGLRAYRTALPFFFGIMVGDITVGAVWSLLSVFLDIPVHAVWRG